MNIFPLRHSTSKGFSLVELLVALTVLSIMVIALATAMGYVSRLWLSGTGAMDNFTKGRLVLNLLDRDIQMMVLRRDMAAFVDENGSSACAFYTNVQGDSTANPTNTRALSVVKYLLATGSTTPSTPATLLRVNYGMNFSSASPVSPLILASNSATGSLTQLLTGTTTTDTVFTGIVRFQIQFIDGSGTILTPPYTYSSTPPASSSPPIAPVPFWFDYAVPGAGYNPRTVVVSMLVLSNPAYTIATQGTTTMTKLLADFPNTLPSPNQTYSQYWNSILNPTTGMLDSTLPAPVRSGIQVFERHIPLPLTTPSL